MCSVLSFDGGEVDNWVLPNLALRLPQPPASGHEMISGFVSFVFQRALKDTQTHT